MFHNGRENYITVVIAWISGNIGLSNKRLLWKLRVFGNSYEARGLVAHRGGLLLQ